MLFRSERLSDGFGSSARAKAANMHAMAHTRCIDTRNSTMCTGKAQGVLTIRHRERGQNLLRSFLSGGFLRKALRLAGDILAKPDFHGEHL